MQSWQGDAEDSFHAPDHEYPSHLELRLTARDSGGLTDSQTVRLDPRTVAVSLESSPSGLTLTLGSSSATAPFTRTLIEGAATSIAAPSPQTQGGNPFVLAIVVGRRRAGARRDRERRRDVQGHVWSAVSGGACSQATVARHS